MDFIRSLLEQPDAQEAPKIDPEKIRTDTATKLDKEAAKDEVDTITFGLETDDGEIVKVYVKADEADEFEKALSEMLGKNDSIEDVLNELSKTFDIVDVEWPYDDGDDGSEGEPGSESLESEVYDNPEEKKDTATVNKEEKTYGQRFVDRLLEQGEIQVGNSAVQKDIVALLEKIGIKLTTDFFIPGIKKRIAERSRAMSSSERSVLRSFVKAIEQGAAPQVNEDIEDAVVMLEDESKDEMLSAKFKTQIEKGLFEFVKYLIVGDTGGALTDFLKTSAFNEFSMAIKNSEFKTGKMRSLFRQFSQKLANVASTSVSEAILNPDQIKREKSFKSDADVIKLAEKSASIAMVLEILAYLGFSDRIVNHSDVKREIMVDVKRKMQKILSSSDGRKLKMMFGYDGKPGLLVTDPIFNKTNKEDSSS